MFSIFPYIFSTTFNAIAGNINRFDNIVDNVVNNIVNSEFIDNLVKNIDEMSPINIQFKEHKRGYTIQCYLPGVKKEDIELDYENNNLIISAKRDEFVEDNNNNFIRKERHYGNFLRSFYVENVDREGIQGRFKDGLLQIIMPKIERKTNRNKRINIQ